MQDEDRGYYTIDNDKEIQEITFEELPEVFQQEYHNRQQREEEAYNRETNFDPDKVEGENKSALFELTISDLTGRGFDGRDPHPLHASDTGANWNIAEGVGHCWRHEVSLNALQFLCVEAGYLNCHEAGTPHKGAGSEVINNDEAIWVAWKHAKENGYIPKDDKIPLRAMKYLARKHDIADPVDDSLLPTRVYNKVLKIAEDEY
jgi:putative DNA primase/helicase